MSDKSQKTEKATPKRKRDAKRKGQVTKSTEIPVAASLIAALIALRAFAPSATRSVVTTAQNLISQSGSGLEMTTVGSMAGQMFVAGVAPFVAVGLGLGLVAGVGQVGFMLAPEAAKPKFSHISPKKGLQRFKPSVAGWDLFRTILKLGLLAVFIYDPIANGVKVLVGTSNLDRALTETAGMVWNVVVRSALLAVLIGGTDYAFNRWRTNRDMKMSKEEVKRESKDAQGDPLVKAQRRRRAMDMSRNRLINVTTADVVVTNPTHFAVALSYSAADPAPRVVAKGTDFQAKRIRKMAARHGVPIIEQRPLARALYRKVKVGKMIPSVLFEAAAVVLAEAYRRRGRRAA